jgi:hypothetical protein
VSEAAAEEQRTKCVRMDAGLGFEVVRVAAAGFGVLSLLLAGCSQKPGVSAVGAPVASVHLRGSAYGGERR